MSDVNRQLTSHERRLVRWMLEHGGPQAAAFLPQLDEAEVTPMKCPCGCATIYFQIRGYPIAPPGAIRVLADFVFGDADSLSGIFVFESGGILKGLEVYGMAGDAPKFLPQPEEIDPP